MVVRDQLAHFVSSGVEVRSEGRPQATGADN